jgi:Fur family peroxide stress response transcriptional regulator
VITPDELNKQLAHLKDGLKRAGVKLTHQRLEIFREVVKSGDHPDAETIFNGVRERVPTVSLDTVYRTLWLLADLGLIATLGPPRDRVRFDANVKPHHHFVCSKCGLTRDFPCEEFDRLQVPDAVRDLGGIEKTQVEVTGICLRCASRTKPGEQTP